MKQRKISNKNKNLFAYTYDEDTLLYLEYFNKIPSTERLNGPINIKYENFIHKLKDWGFTQIINHKTENSSERSRWILDDYLITASTHDDNDKVYTSLYYDFTNPNKEIFNKYIEYTSLFKMPKVRDNVIGIITSTVDGLDIDYIDYVQMDISLDNNYNDDFYDVSKNIIKDLNDKRHGLHILHGIPGTGKTTYIKYLINNVDKNFIFIPPGYVSSITDPQFLTLLITKAKDSIIVIEDAEEALMSSDGLRSSSVSNLLNLADGLLGSILNVQIIATFNSDFNEIDEAILRKGRLLNIYEFNRLNLEKTNNLLKEINSEFNSDKELTLADIYNFSTDLKIHNKQNKIKI